LFSFRFHSSHTTNSLFVAFLARLDNCDLYCFIIDDLTATSWVIECAGVSAVLTRSGSHLRHAALRNPPTRTEAHSCRRSSSARLSVGFSLFPVVLCFVINYERGKISSPSPDILLWLTLRPVLIATRRK